ncbi:MAG TPA: sugar phosphate isomerase/epimerase family protein [Bryobacteraceae bacterium]|nr:sugar phosphate isomerase/epimerase family protein [Bryobacteraceae bacterium]
MKITRRTWLAAAALAPAARLAAAARPDVRIGVTDWNLRLAGKIEALALAKSLGFEGVEVSLGRQAVDGKLPLADPAIQARYVEESGKQGIPLAGTCLDILHVNYLKNDKLGQKWVADAIPITKKLKAAVILLPFFGKGAITETAEQDYVAGVLKEIAPEAEKQGITLGLEDTISAEANARILDLVNSKALRIYYDVGNSTNNGFDIYKEMRWLGKDRICQVHLKDKPYIGEGSIDFPKVIAILAEIGYRGYMNLETSSPSGSIPDDMKKNLAVVRRLMA